MAEIPMDGAVHPLIAARPPTTDNITYLAIIDVNLKKDDLPVLLEILQDEELTRNIGWDLVMTLLPMLPESKSCLKLIARLGNPREVLLKTTEALRVIEHDAPKSVYEEEVEEDAFGEHFHDQGCNHDHGKVASSSGKPSQQVPEPIPASVSQFQTLIEVLRILHPRIKTKYPSRFLSTTLQAVLASLSEATSHIEEMTRSVVSLIRTLMTLSSGARPNLPPRAPSTGPMNVSDTDPEAVSTATVVSDQDKEIQKRLLLSFLTHVFESYATSMPMDDDVPSLAWSARIFERTFPRKSIAGRRMVAGQFEECGQYENRAKLAATCLSLAQDLGATSASLLEAALQNDISIPESIAEELDPPSKPEDIPLSQAGALFLFMEDKTSSFLNDSTSASEPIFPKQSSLAHNFIGREEVGGLATAGSETQAIIDSLVALGLLSLESNTIGEPASDEEFLLYLQRITVVSASTPSASLRYQAHTLVTSVLRSHPSDLVRLAFIRDTLEHCPYENTKASAVSWIKGETLEANAPGRWDSGQERTIFATPVALDALGSVLFPDLTRVLTSGDLRETWFTFRNYLSFYLATLNFYYMLLVAKHLQEVVDVRSLGTNHKISSCMIRPLRKAGKKFRESLMNGELGEEEGPVGVRGALMDLDILDDVLDRAEAALIKLHQV